MRKIFEPQMTFGQTPIDQIKLDMRARDEIPKLLMGLQHIYCDQELGKVLPSSKWIPEDTDSKMDVREWTGRSDGHRPAQLQLDYISFKRW